MTNSKVKVGTHLVSVVAPGEEIGLPAVEGVQLGQDLMVQLDLCRDQGPHDHKVLLLLMNI